MDRHTFHQLLKKYIEGTCSPEERAIIDKWYQLLEDQHIPVPGMDEMQELESRMWDTIKDQITAPVDVSKKSTPVKFINQIWVKWASVAAVLVIVSAGFFVYTTNVKSVPGSLVSAKVAEGLSEEINNTGSVKQVDLEDGSIVLLQPKAKCAFPKHFLKDKREVYLEGEAFFEVAKNANRPFFVYNERLVTRVLGTSFNVKIINDKIEVAVRTGRVAVYEDGQQVNLNEQQKKDNGVIITPNQKVTYYKENRRFITSLVDAPVLVAVENKPATEPKFVFDDTPLSEVLQSLEKNYAVEIILANNDLNNCPFTGDLSQQSLFNKLDFICLAFHASYEVKGTRILINGGQGCR